MFLSKSIFIKKSVELLTPSTISAIFSVTASMIFTIGVIFINRYRPGSLDLTTVYNGFSDKLTGTILQNSIVQNLTQASVVLLATLAVILVIFDLYKQTKNKNYQKALPKILIHIILRIISLSIWAGYLFVLFNYIFPYCTELAIRSTVAASTLLVIVYITLTMIINAAAIEVNVIFLRLLFLKTRLFPGL
jgi:hypothetical protein